jgi:secreted Zn-dependent insulinase-like peptidase
LKDYQEVMEAIFQYISMMRETPPLQWVFDELKDTADIEFKLQEKSPASDFTRSLMILCGPYEERKEMRRRSSPQPHDRALRPVK